MDYVLSNGLLCMILMAMVSSDGWSHLILLALFYLDALLTWSIEDVLMMIPRMLSIIWRTLHTLCRAVAAFDDCTYPEAPPHTSWNFHIGQMSTYVVDIARWAI
jgi:hypothetical protein